MSPSEAWNNGIGRFPGMGSKALHKLPDTARHKLSTHCRQIRVGEQGIRFEVGSRRLVFWGDEAIPYKNTIIPVRWNLEEPELLHCVPPGRPVFTLKLRELPSSTATREQLAEAGRARHNWSASGRILFDGMKHQSISAIAIDSDYGAEVHAEGEAIMRATAEHRAETKAAKAEQRRLDGLSGTLNIPSDVKNRERAIAAALRRKARAEQSVIEL